MRAAAIGAMLAAAALAAGDGAGPAARSGPPSPVALEAACRQTADWLSRQLPDCTVLVRAPLVVAGDFSAAKLGARYEEVLAPTTAALAAEYFATAPSEPVTVLLFSDEESYRRHARQLWGEEPTTRFGCYRPQLRMILVNAAAGPGPLRHELTHALLGFDFPSAPRWLDEGLASLHEDCRHDLASRRLLGETNWRLPMLQEAIARQSLPSLEELMQEGAAEDERLWYAHVRYFCLYLQRQGVLSRFYRELRAGCDGAAALAAIFPETSIAQIDHDFRVWTRELK